MPSTSLFSDAIASISVRLRRSRDTSSLTSKRSNRSSYHPYSVYQQTMIPTILRDHDAARKLFETIIDSPNGRRSMSRLARTCRAMCEPALDVLWKELDSLLPLISLFPNNLMKRARRPGLGLAKAPNVEDWSRVLAYGERVRRIAYIESSPSVSPSVFAVIAENRPVQYILPHLQQLIWRVDTAAGLQRCTIFLNPELQSLVLEVNTKIPQLADFLVEVCSTTQLSAFSFTSPTSLPDSFTDILRSHNTLEKLVLVAPGALSSGVGQWAASLPSLHALELDLTGRSVIAVEGFFDEIITSGASTPSDASSDSGVFSGDEIDFTEIRKSSLRLTGDLRSGDAFVDLRQLSLTGEVANIAVFLKHLTSNLTHLELVIDDPPDMADWQDLSGMICERFSNSLLSLRINATGSSRFNELVRSTSRGGDPPCRHLPLRHITSLPCLLRLEIDLPESVLFDNSDLKAVARACPNIETLRLCPMARFPAASGPSLTLGGVAVLAQNCKRLQTLALVLDARTESAENFNSLEVSSRSLLRLHVGHSVVNDSLQTTILLSHIAPYLETIKWFHEKNRPGYVEANANGWQKVSDWLPHMQGMRLMERARAIHLATKKPEMREQSVDATVTRITSDKGLQVKPRVVQCSIQASPRLVDRSTEARPKLVSASVDATPSIADTGIDATPKVSHQFVGAVPATVSTEVDATVHTESKAIGATEALPYEISISPNGHADPFYAVPSVIPTVLAGLLTFACRIFITYPLRIPMHMIDKSLSMLHVQQKDGDDSSSEKHELRPSPASSSTSELLDHDIPPGYFHAYYSNADWNGMTFTNSGDRPQEQVIAAMEVVREMHMDEPKGTPAQGLAQKWKVSAATQTTPNIFATRHFTPIQDKPYSKSHYSIAMAEVRKQEKDFTKEVDELLPETSTLTKSGQLSDALEKLLVLEKQTRNASDLPSTTRLAKAALELCYETRDYTQLNSTLSLLSKKHGQFKAVVQAIVEQAISWLPEIREQQGVEKWLELVETLRSVTEGKIFLETPRARVTLVLSRYHESLSKGSKASAASIKEALQTASDLLSDLQVETYSSMERREKTEFILEQMRLLIAVARLKDEEIPAKVGKSTLGGGEPEWTKAKVGGRKVNESFLKEKANEDLKLKYYDLMIQQALHQSAYLEVAKHYEKVWDTPSIKEDDSKSRAALEHIVYYVVLAPHNNEQSDMLHHLFANPALEKLELHYNLVKSFVTRELMRWPGIESLYGPFLRTTPVFSVPKQWEDLHTRVVEHNVRVVAQYYTRITLARLTVLLDLTAPQTEETLARLVVSHTIWARVDRPAGIVNFRSKRSAEDVMNDWSSDMQKLLGLVEKTWIGMNAAQAAQSRIKA